MILRLLLSLKKEEWNREGVGLESCNVVTGKVVGPEVWNKGIWEIRRKLPRIQKRSERIEIFLK